MFGCHTIWFSLQVRTPCWHTQRPARVDPCNYGFFDVKTLLRCCKKHQYEVFSQFCVKFESLSLSFNYQNWNSAVLLLFEYFEDYCSDSNVPLDRQ